MVSASIEDDAQRDHRTRGARDNVEADHSTRERTAVIRNR
jgi:hypothetical protein